MKARCDIWLNCHHSFFLPVKHQKSSKNIINPDEGVPIQRNPFFRANNLKLLHWENIFSSHFNAYLHYLRAEILQNFGKGLVPTTAEILSRNLSDGISARCSALPRAIFFHLFVCCSFSPKSVYVGHKVNTNRAHVAIIFFPAKFHSV